MNDTRQLKSYIWHDGQCFFVSTIDRDSSACTGGPPARFMETIAWENDWAKRERGDMVAMSGDGPGFSQHMEMCRQLYLTGKFTEDGDGNCN